MIPVTVFILLSLYDKDDADGISAASIKMMQVKFPRRMKMITFHSD